MCEANCDILNNRQISIYVGVLQFDYFLVGSDRQLKSMCQLKWRDFNELTIKCENLPESRAVRKCSESMFK